MDRRSLAGIVVAFTRAIPGVVDVVDQLSWEVDDGTDDNRYHPGFARS